MKETIFFGADYYPEHWPRERWETDALLMEELGLNVVRMGEFSWVKMEPREGEFHFEWLEEAIEVLAAHGIKTVLGTPTAAPPAWIVRQDPEILPVDFHGRRREFGGRHHDCQSNPHYREHVERIVTAMARRFGNNPNVIGWQIDNELGNSHDDLCMCESCTGRFRRWLEEKYGSVQELNRAWGTHFWSQDYGSFQEVKAPLLTVTGRNPSQMLDWKRFCSDLIVEFQQFQIDILRRLCPGQFITHNLMGLADKVNYFDLSKSLDFVSHDQYPLFTDGIVDPNRRASEAAAPLDLMRSMKKENIWIMEQQSGPSGWECFGHTPSPGKLAMWAVQSIAHGADTVVFFRWRTCSAGTEQYWHGILPHSGIPGRAYGELQEMIRKLQPVLEQTRGQSSRAEVGIVYSYDQEYALKIQPHTQGLDYNDQIKAYYRAFFRRNVPVEFVSDREDFSRYKLLVAPLQYLMDPALEEKYRTYAEQGGTLVLTMRAGVKDRNNLCETELPLPGRLGELLGIRIPEYDCMGSAAVTVTLDGESYTAEKWSDLIELAGGEAAAEYASRFYAGTPAVTVKETGRGHAWYVGTEPGDPLLDALAGKWLAQAGIQGLAETPEGLEIAVRRGETADTFFVLNHAEQPQAFEIPQGWEPAVSQPAEKVLAPFEYRIYRKAR